MPAPEGQDRLFHVSDVNARCRILVMGVGGAGCNSVARMAETWTQGPNVVALNTDTQALAACRAPRCIAIGKDAARGLGAAGDVMVGRLAAEESMDTIQELLSTTDMLFLVVGLGGGTGTGAAPVILQAARRAGVLTLCFATMPFPFEGERKRRVAEEGLLALKKHADVVVCQPNVRLMELVDAKQALEVAFRKADEMVGNGVHGLWRLLSQAGVINLDFADVRTLAERSGGSCAYSYSEAKGPARASLVLQQLLESPMLERGRLLSESSGVLVNITGGPDLTMADVQGLMGEVQGALRPGGHVFFGAIIEPGFKDKLALTVLAAENWLESRRERPKASGTAPGVVPEPELVGAGSGRGQQEELNFDRYDRGRFKGIEPTVFGGEDLDIPTFIRRGMRLSFDH